MSARFCHFSTSSPLSTPVLFLLSNPHPLSIQILSWKKIRELQKLWKNKISLKRYPYLTYFLFASFFQSSMPEDDDKITFKCHLPSPKDHTEKDPHLQLNPLPPLVHFCMVGLKRYQAAKYVGDVNFWLQFYLN